MARYEPEILDEPDRSHGDGVRLRRLPRARAVPSPQHEALYARALALWPRLDRRQLSRTHGDARLVARLVARRTVLTEEAIVRLLGG
jgi:hypothetical protein